MKECELEIHAEKSRIVYCRSDRFTEHHENETFDFLGYTSWTRSVRNGEGKFFKAFTPAVSKTAAKSFREKFGKIVKGVQSWTLEDIARQLNLVIKGWMNYFSVSHSREARKETDYVNQILVRWLKRNVKIVSRSWKGLVYACSNSGIHSESVLPLSEGH